MSSFNYGESSDVSKLPASAGAGVERLPASAGAGKERLPASAGAGEERLPASAGAGEERLPASAGAGEDRLPASAGAGEIWNRRYQELRDLAISQLLRHLKFSISASSDPTAALELSRMQQMDDDYHKEMEEQREEDRLIQDYMEKKAKRKQRKAEEREKERLCAEKRRDHQLWMEAEQYRLEAEKDNHQLWMEAEQYRLEAEKDNQTEVELHWRTEQHKLEHPVWCLVNDSAPSFSGNKQTGQHFGRRSWRSSTKTRI